MSFSFHGRRYETNLNKEHAVKIQVNTDENIEGREAMAASIEAMVSTTLAQFSDHLTRVEVHISDEKAGKRGKRDKRCMMEARPEHQKPMAVTHDAANVHEACIGAAKKLRSLLESHLGKLHDVKGAASIRDNENR